MEGLVTDGEMTKLWKVEYQQTQKGLVLGVQWVGLKNLVFGLGKISLAIGLKVKGKMRRNIEWVVLNVFFRGC